MPVSVIPAAEPSLLSARHLAWPLVHTGGGTVGRLSSTSQKFRADRAIMAEQLDHDPQQTCSKTHRLWWRYVEPGLGPAPRAGLPRQSLNPRPDAPLLKHHAVWFTGSFRAPTSGQVARSRSGRHSKTFTFCDVIRSILAGCGLVKWLQDDKFHRPSGSGCLSQVAA